MHVRVVVGRVYTVAKRALKTHIWMHLLNASDTYCASAPLQVNEIQSGAVSNARNGRHREFDVSSCNIRDGNIESHPGSHPRNMEYRAATECVLCGCSPVCD